MSQSRVCCLLCVAWIACTWGGPSPVFQLLECAASPPEASARTDTKEEPVFGARVRDNGGDGVLVLEVLADSAAAQAGLEPGDVILTINGRVTRSEDDYAAAVDASPDVMRMTTRSGTDGRDYSLTANLRHRLSQRAGKSRLGTSLAEYKGDERGVRALVLELQAVDTSKLVSVSNLKDLPPVGQHAPYKWLVPPEGLGTWQRVGEPELPVFTAAFKIPYGMEVDEVTYHVDPASVEVWQDVWIAPAGPPAADRIGAPMPDRSFDRETYGRDEWYPREPLAAGARFCVRGTQGMHLQVFPFRHNPVRGLLEVARRIEIEVTMRPSGISKEDALRPTWSDAFASVYGSLISDREMPDRDKDAGGPRTKQSGCDYLVFVPDNRSEAIEPLLERKRQRGLQVRKILLSELQARQRDVLQSRILAEIATQYAGTPTPTYLLLVGDDEDIPSFRVTPHPAEFYNRLPAEVASVATDFYYANVEGGDDDLTPELLVGRLPARNAAELQIMVQKILNYENTLPDQDNWTPASWGYTVLAALYDNVRAERGSGEPICVAQRWFMQTADDVTRFLKDLEYPVSTVYMAEDSSILNLPAFYRDQLTPVPDDVALAIDPATTLLQVYNSWNGQLRLLLHRDHGIHDYGSKTLPAWGSPPFDVSHVRSLPAISANGVYPVVFSINCETGFFDDPNKQSLAEELMRSPQGASAVVAASRISFSGWNDRLVEGMVAAIWKEFRLTFDPSFKLEGNTAALDKQPRLGAVLEAGKAHMIRMLPSDLELNRVECEEFTLFGDPEMPLLGISIGE